MAVIPENHCLAILLEKVDAALIEKIAKWCLETIISLL